MGSFHKKIYHNLIRPSRLKIEVGEVNKLNGKTVLDIGYFDSAVKNLLNKKFEYLGIDPDPQKQINNFPICSLEDFNTNKKFDIVLAFDILEHTLDPVFALNKIKEFSKKYVCISVPYEPFYTITRFFIPEEEHFWTIHPNVLEHYFGKPIFEKKFHFKRSYFAIYDLKNK